MSKGTVTIFNSSRSHLMDKESRENNASDTPDWNGSSPIQSPKEAAKKRALGLYISGEMISADLDQQLSNEGYNVKRIINYKVNFNEKFDESFIKELKLNIPDIVYIYSQNSASSFLNFIKIYQTENIWMNTNLMCIGEKTSSILNEIKWKKIFLFNPGEEEFLLYKI